MAHRLIKISDHLGQKENRIKLWRDRHPLDTKELNNLIFTSKYAKIKEEALNIMASNRHIFKHADIQEMDREQERQRAFQMLLTYHKHRRNIVNPINYSQDPHALAITAHCTYCFDPGHSVKTDITYFLYFKTLYTYHTSQLHKDFIRAVLNLQDIGCFGLTELGHGSNARNVTTQAVYIHESKEFIINTPDESGMKFWIGAAAQLANMSVIWAQLIVDGKNCGPHPFIVPIRDKKTMQLLEGVTIGDCGPKNGCQNIDNGFMIFKNVRIPKGYLLDKLSGIDKKGKFYAHIQNPEKRFGTFMGPLSYGRAFVSLNSIAGATNALAIAIRYCCSRRQFSAPNQVSEILLIDYPSMRYRLMPLLAQTIVYYIGGAKILRTYDQCMKEMQDPRNRIIEEMHAISAALKGKSSWFASEVLTQCREAMGGHGYSSQSRLGRFYHDQDINLTWEGDNNMLLQQSTKYILKVARKLAQKGKNYQKTTLHFVNDDIQLQEQLSIEEICRPEVMEVIIKKRITDGIQEIMGALMKFKGEGLSDIQVWNKAQPYYGRKLTFAYGDLYYFHEAMRAIQESSQSLRPVLIKCLELWMLHTLEEERWGSLDLRKNIKDHIVNLCDWIAERSISILDSIAPPYEIIDSVFADEKGQGMKRYVNALFTGKTTFKFYDWQEKIPSLRKQCGQKAPLGKSYKN